MKIATLFLGLILGLFACANAQVYVNGCAADTTDQAFTSQVLPVDTACVVLIDEIIKSGNGATVKYVILCPSLADTGRVFVQLCNPLPVKKIALDANYEKGHLEALVLLENPINISHTEVKVFAFGDSALMELESSTYSEPNNTEPTWEGVYSLPVSMAGSYLIRAQTFNMDGSIAGQEWYEVYVQTNDITTTSLSAAPNPTSGSGLVILLGTTPKKGASGLTGLLLARIDGTVIGNYELPVEMDGSTNLQLPDLTAGIYVVAEPHTGKAVKLAVTNNSW